MKTTIITSIVTTLAVNLFLAVAGPFTYTLLFLVAWGLMGWLARKISSYTWVKNDWPWNYIFCNVVPPIAIAVVIGDAIDSLKRDYAEIFSKIPSFRNPFVWSENNK